MTFTLVFRVLLFCWKLKSKGASHILVLRNDHFVIIWKTNLFKPRLHQYPILRVFKATWSYTPGHEHQSRDLSHGKHHSYAITNCANRCSSKKGNIKYCLIECLPDPMGIVILKIAWIFFDISKLLTWSFFTFSLLLNEEDIDTSSKDASCDPNYVHTPSRFVLITPKYEHNLFMEI